MKQLSVLTLGMWPGQYVQLEQVKKKGKYPPKSSRKSLFCDFIARTMNVSILDQQNPSMKLLECRRWTHSALEHSHLRVHKEEKASEQP